MQFKFAFVAAALATLVAAQGNCSTGSQQCCQLTLNSTEAETNPTVEASGLISVILSQVGALVGLECTSVVGAGW